MHGDFSRWFGKIPKNQVGILAQEGRILLDADVNAHALLGARWQDFAARAAFGAHIAAIPADTPNAWKVASAGLNQGTVTLQVMPGPAWADGLLVELEGDPTKGVTLQATPLGPPIQTPPQNLGAAGTRDAVILEVWRRSLNGYQSPADLIEPALGGPDTAERIETAYALRLYRMAAGDTCRSLDLNDKLATHGHLTVTIAPTTMTAGDCPVVQGGGYTGLEHDLYRIEIADVDSGTPSFKWSQWNGGLVGRGVYDGAAKKLTLHAGDQAVLRSGLTSFYLEALVFDTAAGHWRVQYGVPATLDTNGDIDLSQAAAFGAPPDPAMVTNPSDPTDTSWFVRIWNDLRPVSDFPSGGAKELRDGIRLELSGTTFVPGDYWTFPVRAQLDNPPTLLSDAPPFGVHHHRVPLAELDWTGQGATIEDCRIPLHPITATDGCCTHSVGDGITSYGDFTSIQDAINALPGEGGRVCVLPGTYTENVQVLAKTNIEIVGCGPRSRIVAKPPADDAAQALPAIYVLDTSGIKIEKLYVEAGRGGIAILLEADAAAGQIGIDAGQASTPFLEDMRIADCEIRGGGGSGIEIRGGQRSEIVHNRVTCANLSNDWALITVATQESRIERNVVSVDDNSDHFFSALGGIWLRGGCLRIDVIDNEIERGAGHGVMLGHVEQSIIYAITGVRVLKIRPNLNLGFVLNGLTGACVGCGPGPVVFPTPPTDPQAPNYVAGASLQDIRIRDNDIREMGISGIGVIGFFSNDDQGIIHVDGLSITGNRLVGNVTRGSATADDNNVTTFGYGAISLDAASALTIHGNDLHQNGTRISGQVCGIFVRHGEGVEVSNNRLYDNGWNGPKTSASLPHGGVWLSNLIGPLEGGENVAGRPSAVVRDNEIDTNNGPGLVMDGLGYYSIVANTITTRSSLGVTNKATAVNVSIINNSAARDIQWNSYAGLRDRALELAQPLMAFKVGNKAVAAAKLTEAELATAKLTVKLPPRPDAAYITPPGSTIFANNHVFTYAPQGGTESAVNIQSLSDVTVTGNHFMTFEPEGWFMFPTPVVISGADVQVQNNRCVDQALFWSLYTIGNTNITTYNTTDHCIVVKGNTVFAGPNIERFTGLCNIFGNSLVNVGVSLGETKA
jgi:hypothetical protein